MNPYAKFLDGRPIEIVLAETAAKLRAGIEAIGPERWNLPPAPGKWSAAEIVAHMADCEIAHAFRLRQLLAEDNPTIQPFDQNQWAFYSQGLPVATALYAFAALRAWSLCLIATAFPQAAARTIIHPESGLLTGREYLERMAGHDLDHLAQLNRLANPA